MYCDCTTKSTIFTKNARFVVRKSLIYKPRHFKIQVNDYLSIN